LAKKVAKNGRWEYRFFSSTGALIQQEWINIERNNFEVNVSSLHKRFYIVEVRRMGIVHVAGFVKG